jgi:hypothetical protein
LRAALNARVKMSLRSKQQHHAPRRAGPIGVLNLADNSFHADFSHAAIFAVTIDFSGCIGFAD